MVLPSLFYKTLQILYFQYYLQIISKDIKKANTCFFNRCNTSVSIKFKVFFVLLILLLIFFLKQLMDNLKNLTSMRHF